MNVDVKVFAKMPEVLLYAITNFLQKEENSKQNNKIPRLDTC